MATRPAIADCMLQGHEHAGTNTVLACLVHKNCAAFEHVARIFQRNCDCRVQQRVTGRYQGGLGFGRIDFDLRLNNQRKGTAAMSLKALTNQLMTKFHFERGRATRGGSRACS